jgi:PleD family two-component response regulator
MISDAKGEAPMPASVFDYTAIRARLDELGERQRRILVVDDLKIMVELLATYLESEHYVVSEAFDELQALAKIATEQPDSGGDGLHDAEDGRR